jgi:glycylpeptide N-tetradecanoyltransferase
MTMVGFISGTVINVSLNGNRTPLMEINYLCIHDQLRNNCLAPLLIKEITRRSVLKGINSAIYTVGKKITEPLTVCHYNNIYLNIQKLKECKFINEGFVQQPSLYRIRNEYIVRQITEKDTERVIELLTNYMKKYTIHQIFDHQEIEHFLSGVKSGVIQMMVIENKGHIIGMFSMYSLPSKILFENEYQHDHIKFANLYYYAYDPKEMNINDIMYYSKKTAKEYGYDILSYLNIMDNKYYLNTDNVNNCELNYYLYNYNLSCKVTPDEIGLLFF